MGPIYLCCSQVEISTALIIAYFPSVFGLENFVLALLSIPKKHGFKYL